MPMASAGREMNCSAATSFKTVYDRNQHHNFQINSEADNDQIENRIENLALFLDILWEVMVVEFRRLRLRVPVLDLRARAEYIRGLCLGEHRNAIRAFASALPIQSHGRFILLTQIRQIEEYEDNMAQVPSVEDVLDVLDTGPGEGIVLRSYNPQVTVPHCSIEPHVKATNSRTAATIAMSRMSTSTPIFDWPALDLTLNTTSQTITDPEEQGVRIASLESELGKLREQMMAIVRAKEGQSVKCASPSSDSGLDDDPVPLVSKSQSVPKCNSAAPPPPPPPPPDMLRTKPATLATPTAKLRKSRQSKSPKVTHENTFANVLSEMKNGASRLRPVTNRSPGGTPSRKRKSLSQPISAELDPAAYLAAALQKKFASVAFDCSPATSCERYNDNNGAGDSSWMSTPPGSPTGH